MKRENPVDNIQWLPAKDLKANSYNPNIVFNKELRLLEFSILSIGWTQPILITPGHQIIDGFHRWRLSQESKKIQAAFGGLVPCGVINCTEAEGMCITVRMNRAKGTHVAVRVSELVRSLHDEHNWPYEKIAEEIGANVDEVRLLYDGSIFKERNLADYKYSNAWEPGDSRNDR